MKRRGLVFLMLLLATRVFAEEVSGGLTTEARERLKSVAELSATSMATTKGLNGLVEIRQEGLPFGAIRGFDAEEVRGRTVKIRGDLEAALAPRELAGLKAYAMEFFPAVELRTVVVDERLRQGCSVTPCPVELAEPESAVAAMTTIHEFVGKVTGASAYKVSFRVRSNPPGARFSIGPMGGGFETQVGTNGSVGELFRGLYRYEIQKVGFKPVTATLNLVDNDPEELFCDLQPADGGSDPIPCVFAMVD